MKQPPAGRSRQFYNQLPPRQYSFSSTVAATGRGICPERYDLKTYHSQLAFRASSHLDYCHLTPVLGNEDRETAGRHRASVKGQKLFCPNVL